MKCTCGETARDGETRLAGPSAGEKKIIMARRHFVAKGSKFRMSAASVPSVCSRYKQSLLSCSVGSTSLSSGAYRPDTDC